MVIDRSWTRQLPKLRKNTLTELETEFSEISVVEKRTIHHESSRPHVVHLILDFVQWRHDETTKVFRSLSMTGQLIL